MIKQNNYYSYNVGKCTYFMVNARSGQFATRKPHAACVVVACGSHFINKNQNLLINCYYKFYSPPLRLFSA